MIHVIASHYKHIVWELCRLIYCLFKGALPFAQLTDKKRPFQKPIVAIVAIVAHGLHIISDSNVKKHGYYIVKLNPFRRKKILS